MYLSGNSLGISPYLNHMSWVQVFVQFPLCINSFLHDFTVMFVPTACFTTRSPPPVSMNQRNFHSITFPRGNFLLKLFFHSPSIISLSVPLDLYLLLQVQLKPLWETHEQVNTVTNGRMG